MVNVNDVKNGMTIEVDGNIFTVLEFQHVKPGKGAAIVKMKLKNLRTGAIYEQTFNAGIKVGKALIEKKNRQYLEILYSNPAGCLITAGMTTNYRQLKTIYHQRKKHRLPEWRSFCRWIETLPNSELITGKCKAQ